MVFPPFGGFVKIAIVGHNSLAFQQAYLFDQLGAAVTLFLEEQPLIEHKLKADQFGPIETLYELSCEAHPQVASDLNLDPNGKLGSYSQAWEKFYGPLMAKVFSNVKVRQVKVKRIHKRFLNLQEEVPNHSRLYDLYRIVFSHDPSGTLKEQLESNKEIFKDMPEEVIKSLVSKSEGFEDFDAVIESSLQGFKMGPAGTDALNEAVVGEDELIYYGLVDDDFKNKIENISTLSIVGSDELSALNILSFKEKLLSGSLRLIVITDEKSPFAGLRSRTELKYLSSELFKLFDDLEAHWKNRCDEYQEKLHTWRALEPHVRLKEPAPELPQLPLEMFHGYNVTALDKLIDREGLFLTIEKPAYRINDEEVLKTVGTDAILVTRPASFYSKCFGMRTGSAMDCIQENEPGMYYLHQLADVQLIQDNLLSFFSRN